MSDEEVLLILSETAADDARRRAEALPVVQQVSPRVRVVRADADQIAELGGLPGLYFVTGDSVPAEAALALNDTERLFADAWLARIPESEKKRRGEGLPWDTTGFEPPDSL